jgi:hypothetical protein
MRHVVLCGGKGVGGVLRYSLRKPRSASGYRCSISIIAVYVSISVYFSIYSCIYMYVEAVFEREMKQEKNLNVCVETEAKVNAYMYNTLHASI